MKKRLTLFSLLLLFTMTAMARTLVVVGALYYYLNDSKNTAEVTQNPYGASTNYSGDIVIPASISVDGVDYSVTSIGSGAFFGCDGLRSIEIPNSVISIGEYAFLGCSSLTSIEIPNSVIWIGNGAFSDCSNLTSIEIPNSVTSIGYNAFASCSGLTSIEIPTSVTSIGDYVFYDCSGLTSIEIPNSVTSIGEASFASCSGLTSITMQRATPPIVGYDIFLGCNNLETIYVPVGASEAYNVVPWNEYNIVEREVAGIEEVTQEEWPADVYDLNGRMVKAQAESLDGLPKGVYIVNGKKFVK